MEVMVHDAPPAVVINEILYDGVGVDSHEVFVELTGTAGTPLDGFALVGINGSDGLPYRSVPLAGVRLNPQGRAVIVHADAQTHAPALAELANAVGDVDFQNGPDAVLLLWRDSIVADAVGYGFGGEGRPAVDVAAGQSLCRRPMGHDTNDNASDFAVCPAPSPGA
jgi:hypothetical protein